MQSPPEPEAPRPVVGQSFPPRLRIQSGRHFQRAYKQGSRARGGILVVVAVENGLPHPRLGLSVGRTIWKRAVQRNRVRRIFREAFRISRAQLPGGFDYVLIPAAPRLDPPLAETCAELVRLARKAVARQLEKRASSPDREAAPGPGAGGSDPAAAPPANP